MRACLRAHSGNTGIARIALPVMALAGCWPAAGQDVKAAVARLESEANAFEKLATQVTGEETLRHSAMKPGGRRLRIGEGAQKPSPLKLKESKVVSLYGISVIGRALHEIRQVVSVDGKTVQGEARAQETLAQLLTASGEDQKLQALRQLEKYGVNSAATDFGPLILLFASGGAERYEFTAAGPRLLGTESARAYHFKQLDGSEAVTLFNGGPQKLRIEGEAWISEAPRGRIRLVLASASAPTRNEPRVRVEASVDYARSTLGALLPEHIEQRETHGGELASENIFDYKNFQRLAD
jgi:hypothetical protein